MSKTRRWIAIALAAALTALVAAVAAPAASGEPSAVFTTITTNFTSSFAAVNPCTGGTGTVELAGRDVLHVTDFGGGIFHVLDTQTGMLTFTPDDPAALTLVGHYTTTFSDQSNPPGLQFTVGGPFNVVAGSGRLACGLQPHRTNHSHSGRNRNRLLQRAALRVRAAGGVN